MAKKNVNGKKIDKQARKIGNLMTKLEAIECPDENSETRKMTMKLFRKLLKEMRELDDLLIDSEMTYEQRFKMFEVYFEDILDI